MVGFWKKNSYDIVRLFINQVGIAIFALVLSFAVTAAFDASATGGLLFVSIFAVLFYLFLLYSVGWEVGGKDRLHIDAQKGKIRSGKGIALMLFAQIPNFVFMLLMLIGGAIVAGGAMTGGSRVFAIGYFPEYFLSSMYTGILKSLISAVGIEQTESVYYLLASLFFFLTTLPAIAVTGFAYWMGVHEKRIIPAAKNKRGKIGR